MSQHPGSAGSGYVVAPDSGTGPGVLVLHAWWGLTPFFRSICDRLADEGFVALAPDLHGDDRTASGRREATARAFASASRPASASGVSPGAGLSSTPGATTSKGRCRRDSSSRRYAEVDARINGGAVFIGRLSHPRGRPPVATLRP